MKDKNPVNFRGPFKNDFYRMLIIFSAHKAILILEQSKLLKLWKQMEVKKSLKINWVKDNGSFC